MNALAFSYYDWQQFQSLNTLCQKAGASRGQLGDIVMKELIDNAYDAAGIGGQVTCKIHNIQSFTVQNSGDGIPLDQVQSLFSFNRPLTTSKLMRLPSRGALGNGLRVVIGAVYASNGRLIVETQGQKVQVIPQVDGFSVIERLGESDGIGTAVHVELGGDVRLGALYYWMPKFLELFSNGDYYKGKTSAHWYDASTFFSLCRAYQGNLVDLVAAFDGCSGKKSWQLAKGAKADTEKSAKALLDAMRQESKAVNPDRLGALNLSSEALAEVFGDAPGSGQFYSKKTQGFFTLDGCEIPFVLEAYGTSLRGDDSHIFLGVNRSLTMTQGKAFIGKGGDCSISLAEQWLEFSGVKVPKGLALVVHIITPYMPITNDGKTPDLGKFADALQSAISSVLRAIKKALPPSPSGKTNKRESIAKHLPEAINRASDNGAYPFSLRQLFYKVRPGVITDTGDEPDYDYFCSVVGDWENRHSEIAGMYRDIRGSFYHPHMGESLELGTKMVNGYERPEWTFNKVLFVEKEGFFELLKAVKFPERYDCALLSSKGFASRAAKDLIDLLAESTAGKEPLQVFCLHDADAPGTMIYQSLQEATKARPGRKIEVINLGLDIAEALAMGLQTEATNYKKSQPVADYVPEKWQQYLQKSRVELNAMDSKQFLEWLEQKMQGFLGKVLPPPEIVQAEALEQAAKAIDKQLKDALYASYQEVMEKKARELLAGIPDFSADDVAALLERQKASAWRDVTGKLVQDWLKSQDLTIA